MLPDKSSSSFWKAFHFYKHKSDTTHTEVSWGCCHTISHYLEESQLQLPQSVKSSKLLGENWPLGLIFPKSDPQPVF